MVASWGVFSVYPKAHAGSEACTLLCCSGNSIPWDDDLLKRHIFFGVEKIGAKGVGIVAPLEINKKMRAWKTISVVKQKIFSFHVNFPGRTCHNH